MGANEYKISRTFSTRQRKIFPALIMFQSKIIALESGYWREGRKLGSWRLISVQPLIGSNIMAFSISSALRVLEVLCCHILIEFLSNRSLHVMVDSCLSKLVNVVLGVQHGSVLDPSLFLLNTFLRSFFPFWKISRPVMLMTPLWWLLCHPQVL